MGTVKTVGGALLIVLASARVKVLVLVQSKVLGWGQLNAHGWPKLKELELAELTLLALVQLKPSIVRNVCIGTVQYVFFGIVKGARRSQLRELLLAHSKALGLALLKMPQLM